MNVGCSIGATAFNKLNVILQNGIILNALYRMPNVILVSDSVQCHSAECNSTECHSVACHSAERHFGCWMLFFWISFWCLSLCWMPLCLMSFCKMLWWHLKVKGCSDEHHCCIILLSIFLLNIILLSLILISIFLLNVINQNVILLKNLSSKCHGAIPFWMNRECLSRKCHSAKHHCTRLNYAVCHSSKSLETI